MSANVVRVALLLCDTPLPPIVAKYGNYRDIFEAWLRGALASHPKKAVSQGVTVVLDGFDLVNGADLPSVDSLRPGPDGYDAVMLTGSKYTAHERSPAFVPKLIEFIGRIARDQTLSHLKILGICFGHQVISLAMGGISTRGPNGWEIGVYGCQITAKGRDVFLGPDHVLEHSDRLYIEQMHRDHVPEPPEGFLVCLSTDKYPVQAMIKYHEDSGRPHIFTIQGHPEFTPEIVHDMVEYRIAAGIFDEATGAEARRRAWGKGRQGGEGLSRVGWAVWDFLLG